MGGGITGDGFARLDALVSAMDGDALSKAIISRATDGVAKVAAEQYGRGAGPTGETWPPKQDGGVPLAGLTSQIVFRATSSGIEAIGPDTLRYHEKTRPVFPSGDALPAPWAAAADEGADKAVAEALGKGK